MTKKIKNSLGEVIVRLRQVSWVDDDNQPTYEYVELGEPKNPKLWLAFGMYIVSDNPPVEGALPVDEARYELHN